MSVLSVEIQREAEDVNHLRYSYRDVNRTSSSPGFVRAHVSSMSLSI